MTNSFRWYGHPLSSAIAAIFIALIAPAANGPLIGGATLIARVDWRNPPQTGQFVRVRIDEAHAHIFSAHDPGDAYSGEALAERAFEHNGQQLR